MIKQKYLDVFDNLTPADKSLFADQECPVEPRITFLKKMTDEEIRLMGNAMYGIFPKRCGEQFFSRAEETSFADDFRKEYGIGKKFRPCDRKLVRSLLNSLNNTPELSPEIFFDAAKKLGFNLA